MIFLISVSQVPYSYQEARVLWKSLTVHLQLLILGRFCPGHHQKCIAFGTSTVCPTKPLPLRSQCELPTGVNVCISNHDYISIVLAAFGTIGGMLFGFEISSMSAWIGAKQYMDYFDSPNSTEQGGITASMSAGSFVGALVAGWIADRLGRKGAIQVAAIIWIIGAVLQCSAQNVAHLIVGRIVGGLAIGITSSQCLVYLAELAPSKTRGGIVGIQQWSIEWGMSSSLEPLMTARR